MEIDTRKARDAPLHELLALEQDRRDEVECGIDRADPEEDVLPAEYLHPDTRIHEGMHELAICPEVSCGPILPNPGNSPLREGMTVITLLRCVDDRFYTRGITFCDISAG